MADKCPRCGAETLWSDGRRGLHKRGFKCNSFVNHLDALCESTECLRRQISQRNARIAELEAKLAADRKPTANDRAIERIKKYADDGVCADDWDQACVDCCRHILHIIREEADNG